MLTDEQKAFRKTGISATDLPAILGLNPWRNSIDVYLDKIGQNTEIEETDAIYFGTHLEPLIADRYASLNNLNLIISETLKHPTHPHILATPDRLIDKQKVGIEIKTVGFGGLDGWKGNQIPPHYLLQVHQNLFVTDYSQWILLVLFGGNELKEYKVERDSEYDLIIESECTRFWHEHVLPKKPPKVDFAQPNTLESIKKLYNKLEMDDVLNLTEAQANLVKEWQREKELANKHDKQAKEYQARVLEIMGNNAVAIMPFNEGQLVRRKIVTKEHVVKGTEYIRLDYGRNKNE